jgi:hypothetical protein
MEEALMKNKSLANKGDDYKAWSLDQLTKSEFFHQKLHEWGLLALANQIEKIKGETLEWDLNQLGISEHAWNKVIHCGIKPAYPNLQLAFCYWHSQ